MRYAGSRHSASASRAPGAAIRRPGRRLRSTSPGKPRQDPFRRTSSSRSLPLETSFPGVFAVGDVRAGSTKRVAAAVGQGTAVVAQIHTVLALQPEQV